MTLLEPPGSPGTFWFLKCLEKKPTFFPLVDAPPMTGRLANSFSVAPWGSFSTSGFALDVAC